MIRNEDIEKEIEEGIKKLKQGKTLIVGKNQYVKYENECFVWIEYLKSETNKQTLSETAVRMHLYLCDDWI